MSAGRILLDECVPRRLARELSGLLVSHVTDEGWEGRRNGELLRELLVTGFDTLVTVDQNLVHQQDVAVWVSDVSLRLTRCGHSAFSCFARLPVLSAGHTRMDRMP